MSDPSPKQLIHAEELLSKGDIREALKINARVETAVWRNFFNGDYEQGIDILLHCKDLYEKIGKDSYIANNLSNLSSFYSQKGEKNEGLKYAKKSLEIYEQLNDQAGIARGYSLLAYNYGFNVNPKIDLAIEFAKKSLSISEINPSVKAENLKNLAIIYSTQGRIDESLQYAEEGYKFAQDYKNLRHQVARNSLPIRGGVEKDIFTSLALCSLVIGYNLRIKDDDLTRATEYFKISLKHSKEAGFIEIIGWALYNLTQNYLYLGSYEQAQECLKELEKTAKGTKDKTTFKLYLMAKAIVLKAGGRSRDRAEAEKLLKQIVADEITNPLVYRASVSHLCEFLLEELEMSNNLEIINEIEPQLNSLLNYTEKTHSFYWASLTKGIQAKLALIQLNFEESRRLLTEAQRIAEQHNFQVLGQYTSLDHDRLLVQLNKWEQLKEDNAPMSERIKLASFDIIINRMQGIRGVDPPDLVEEEPILLLIMSKGGNTYFNHSFASDWDIEGIFSSFISAFNTFSSELFSKSIDRIRIGENTILINPVEPFLACYVIKGQSYPALQKLSRFTEAIRENTEIWQALNKSVKTSEMLEIDKPPVLKTVINEIFTH